MIKSCIAILLALVPTSFSQMIEPEVLRQELPVKTNPVFSQAVKHLASVSQSKYNVKGQLHALLKSHETLTDEVINKLLISPRQGVHHLLYDEVMQLMYEIKAAFPKIIKLESIGKTHQGRDIWMLKLDAHRALERKGLSVNTQDNKERKAILLTGAHHARELVSVQMPLFMLLDLLQGLVHEDPEKLILLQRNKFFFIPMVNADGSYKIFDYYQKTGQLLLKRKNMDDEYQKAANQDCGEMEMGVDINRNYGYNFKKMDDVCSESFPGDHAFSEPETRAMRDMLHKYNDTIKFVYNFHSYGPMYVWPYNSELANELEKSNPEAQRIFNEIWDHGKFPSSTLKGNAITTVGYLASGEANDYIMHEFNIPSVSPELANDDYFSNDFFLPYDFVARSVLRDNYPWIFMTFKKLAGQLHVNGRSNATF